MEGEISKDPETATSSHCEPSETNKETGENDYSPEIKKAKTDHECNACASTSSHCEPIFIEHKPTGSNSVPENQTDFESLVITHESVRQKVTIRKRPKPAYKTARILQMMQRHLNKDSGKFICIYCGKAYIRGLALYRHIMYECLGTEITRNNSCPYCVFASISKRSLVVHMARKHMEKLLV